MAIRKWNKAERQRQSRQVIRDRPWEQATGACKARPGNTNSQKTGLNSKVVLRFRRLERIYLADPTNLAKLEAVESAREVAIQYVALIFLAATDPVAKVQCREFLSRQVHRMLERYGGMPLIKGRLRF